MFEVIAHPGVFMLGVELTYNADIKSAYIALRIWKYEILVGYVWEP